MEKASNIVLMPVGVVDLSGSDMFADESDFEFEIDTDSQAAAKAEAKPFPNLEEKTKVEKAAAGPPQPAISQVDSSGHVSVNILSL